jgi:hypothetical protein
MLLKFDSKKEFPLNFFLHFLKCGFCEPTLTYFNEKALSELTEIQPTAVKDTFSQTDSGPKKERFLYCMKI